MGYLAGFTYEVERRRRIVAVDVRVFDSVYGSQYRWCTLSCGHRSTVAAWRPFEIAECDEWRCTKPHESEDGNVCTGFNIDILMRKL